MIITRAPAAVVVVRAPVKANVEGVVGVAICGVAVVVFPGMPAGLAGAGLVPKAGVALGLFGATPRVPGPDPGVPRPGPDVPGLGALGLGVVGPGTTVVGSGTAVLVVVGAATVLVVVVVVVGGAVVVLVVGTVKTGGGLKTGGAAVVVVVGVAATLAVKLLVIVAVQVTVVAPVLPDPTHWLIVVGRPVSCEDGAVTVHVSVPPAPPELLHWVTLCPAGPPLPA